MLVVDDDESNRESLSRRLQRRGMTVDVAVDGTEALARIATTQYDLVLLDVMMPGLSGIEVLQEVRKTTSPAQLPIIMATANDGSNDIAQALELGANDYVTKPIDFTVTLARVKTQLDMRRAALRVLALQENLNLRNAELEQANEALRRSAARTRSDLELAARVQATFLPRSLPPDTRYRVAWRYLPCEELAGDSLNVCPLGPDHLALYVFDVSGHGVASSLTAVTTARMLAPGHDPASILVDADGPRSPAAVMTDLASRFTFDAETSQFITCFYGLVDLRTGRLDYTSAGHPDALVVPREGPPRNLVGTGLPIGIGESYEQHTTLLAGGDRLWIYSDGVIEAMSDDHVLFGISRLAHALETFRPESLDATPDHVIKLLEEWRGNVRHNDDISILAFEAMAI